ncbi:MAG: NAD(P)-dependent oxidoreductase [Proteobacteria bacterium]|nr:NAD(P)-dependent oxidoreductase [Pseudomonadota bacterium]
MKRVALLGANSLMAQDFRHLAAGRYAFLPYGRKAGLLPLERYGEEAHDVVVHCIGAGDASRFTEATAEAAEHYDKLAMWQAKAGARYIYLSSGAAYGLDFSEPADGSHMMPAKDAYGQHKQRLEAEHRQAGNVVDVRVFSYVSAAQALDSRMFMPTLWRALASGEVARIGVHAVWRDFLHPLDFCALLCALIEAPALPESVDAVSRTPTNTHVIAAAMAEKFGLRWEMDAGVAAGKPHYFSTRHSTLYAPRYSSLEAVLEQTGAWLAESASLRM